MQCKKERINKLASIIPSRKYAPIAKREVEEVMRVMGCQAFEEGRPCACIGVCRPLEVAQKRDLPVFTEEECPEVYALLKEADEDRARLNICGSIKAPR